MGIEFLHFLSPSLSIHHKNIKERFTSHKINKSHTKKSVSVLPESTINIDYNGRLRFINKSKPRLFCLCDCSHTACNLAHKNAAKTLNWAKTIFFYMLFAMKFNWTSIIWYNERLPIHIFKNIAIFVLFVQYFLFLCFECISEYFSLNFFKYYYLFYKFLRVLLRRFIIYVHLCKTNSHLGVLWLHICIHKKSLAINPI